MSVIVPAFNAEAHLADAIESVVRQTFRDWEVVVADDASTDSTSEIAMRFGSTVRLVRSSTNEGPAAARNRAIATSSAELLAFLDADDYLLPDFLESQVRLLDESRAGGVDVGIVACDARILGPDGFLERSYLDHVGRGPVTVDRLVTSNPVFVSTLCPRDVVEDVGGYCPTLRHAEDHDLWLRIVERGHGVVVSHRQLAVYRVHGHSLSADPGPIARGTRVVLLRALERGNLSPAQRRVAKRELRRNRAIERIVSPRGGLDPVAMLRAAPLLLLVVLENPRRWTSFARVLASKGRRLSRFDGQARPE